jgi:hypothetical protein
MLDLATSPRLSPSSSRPCPRRNARSTTSLQSRTRSVTSVRWRPTKEEPLETGTVSNLLLDYTNLFICFNFDILSWGNMFYSSVSHVQHSTCVIYPRWHRQRRTPIDARGPVVRHGIFRLWNTLGFPGTLRTCSRITLLLSLDYSMMCALKLSAYGTCRVISLDLPLFFYIYII